MITLLMFVLVPIRRGDIKILNTPDGSVGSAPCARTCAGIWKWDGNLWGNSKWFLGKVYKWVHIADCDFVTPPVVTAATGYDIGGTYNECPSVFVHGVGATSFFVCSVEDTTATKMRDARCDINWSAFGYVC